MKGEKICKNGMVLFPRKYHYFWLTLILLVLNDKYLENILRLK